MNSTRESEWYVVAAVFTVHVILAAIFLTLWIGMFVAVFLFIAWLAAKL